MRQQPVHRLAAVVGQRHLGALAGKDALRDFAIDFGVVDHQNPHRIEPLPRRAERCAVFAETRFPGRGHGVVKIGWRHRFGQHRIGQVAVRRRQQFIA